MLNLLDPLEGLSKDVSWIRKVPAKTDDLKSLDLLPSHLKKALETLKVESLYSHQVECYKLIKDKKDVIITTPSASGKSLAYQISIADTIVDDRLKTALFLFPTKVLTREQAKKFTRLLEAIDCSEDVTIYDGDTPKTSRKNLRGKGRFLFTNPDMLHVSILPNHHWWADFLKGLAFLVVDELHVYNGVFGSHFANLMIRLDAIAKHYGSRYTILATSATIANPEEHARKIFDREFVAVSDSGAYEPARYLIAIDPPQIPYLGYAASLIRTYLQYGIHLLTFVRTKRECEVLLNLTRKELSDADLDPLLVAGYRAGYLDSERRNIERGFQDGKIAGIIATSALELGIDIGHLQVTTLVGFPRDIASFWQQIGRAGRRGGSAVAIILATRHPIDRFLLNHPDYLFQSPERAVINPSNPEIKAAHEACLDYELPARRDFDISLVIKSKGQTPARNIDLRSGSGRITIKDHSQVIGQLECRLAPLFLFPGAVYLHQGQTYIVKRLDLRLNYAQVAERELDYFTEPVVVTDITILEKIAETEGATLDRVRLNIQLQSYRKIGFDDLEVVDQVPLDLKVKGYETIALTIWCDDCQGIFFPLQEVAGLFVRSLPGKDIMGGYSDRTIFFYDAYPGGVGITRELFYNMKDWIKAGHELVEGCPCQDGCPSCIGRPGNKKLIVEKLKMLMFRYA